MNSFLKISSALLAVTIFASGCDKVTRESSQPVRVPPTVTSVTSAQLNDAVRGAKAPAVMVNMWATWCVPCVEEMPDLLRLHDNYRDKGMKLILVSWDNNPKLAANFLGSKGVTFESFIKDGNESDSKFIEGIEDQWSGALPATFLFDANGKLVAMWEGKEPYEVFEKKLLEILKPSPQKNVQESSTQ
jgi:thiol-disulfide isomerase/thioredoxin